MTKDKNSKTKVVSLVVLAFLAIPALFFSERAGEVLGVKESTTDSSIEGSVGSGAREVVEDDSKAESETYEGKALWDNAQEEAVIASDTISPGQTIKIQSKDGIEYYIIENTREGLSDDVLLILNTDTFIRLGGNPEISNSIDVTITLD